MPLDCIEKQVEFLEKFNSNKIDADTTLKKGGIP
jgi:hypothetical protein